MLPMDAFFEPFVRPEVRALCARFKEIQGRGVIVGGWVRNRLLRSPMDPQEDVDVEVFGIAYDALNALLKGVAVEAFPRFGVLRLKNHIDVSIPRVEQCTGANYNDFYVQLKPQLSFKEAAYRRDFTVNALGWDPLERRFYDPFGGFEDLQARQLRPISEHFKEDSYRVLRAAQLIARFNFRATPLLLALAQHISPKNLSPKHIQKTQQILSQGPYKAAAFAFLKQIGWDSVLSRN